MSKYEVKYSKSFKKDLKLAKRQNKNLDELYKVIGMLANDEELPEKYQDHYLHGTYEGYHECHIEPDFLLVYQIQEDVLVLLLYRLGTHSNLFKKKNA